MRELARFLVKNAILDFEGGITIDQVRKYLRDDDSREARALMSRLIEDKGVEELLVVVADCLREHLASGINEEVVTQQLASYTDS